MRILSLALGASLLCALPSLSPAADPPEAKPSPAKDEKPGAKAEEKNDAEPKLSITEHSVTIGGQIVKYRATVGYLIEKAETDGAPEGKDGKDDKAAQPDADGLKPKGKIFFTAYTRLPDAGADRAARPVTFAINGGPAPRPSGSISARSAPAASPSHPQEKRPRRPTSSPITKRAGWIAATSFSSIPSPPVTAAPPPARRPRISTPTKRISPASPSSSASTSPARSAGSRRNSSSAKATAPPVPPPSRIICRSATAFT